MLFTWSPSTRPVVYIDGEALGFKYTYKSRITKEFPDYGRFMIGKSTNGNVDRQGKELN